MLKYSVLFLFVLSLVACKKDSVAPTGPTNPVDPTVAVFALSSTTGSCYTTIVQGTYYAGIPLGLSNKVIVQVNVTTKGTYSISTVTLNNYHFTATGTFTATGFQTLTLQGIGTPTSIGVNTFPILPASSACSFSITVLDPLAPPGDNDNMYFGNPSEAAPIEDSTNNYLMKKTYYALSYSQNRGIPNWVSWHLFTGDLGTVPRQDDFREDVTLPAGWYQVPPGAYTSSGFDKGHNTPSSDRNLTVEANSSTFLMTNMIPQAPNMNQLPWARMEDSLRRLVNLGSEVYIIMGSYGVGGTGNNGYTTTINSGNVTVPSRVWKIAVVIPDGNSDSSRVTTGTRVIAVDMPNTNTVNSNWKNYRVSVDAIEAATGYDLLKRLPVALQTVLESSVDNL